jgi:hypothetical protein
MANNDAHHAMAASTARRIKCWRIREISSSIHRRRRKQNVLHVIQQQVILPAASIHRDGVKRVWLRFVPAFHHLMISLLQ